MSCVSGRRQRTGVACLAVAREIPRAVDLSAVWVATEGRRAARSFPARGSNPQARPFGGGARIEHAVPMPAPRLRLCQEEIRAA